MNVQLGRGKVHYSTTTEGFMPGPSCGGNRAVEGYRVVTAEVDCKNCLKIIAAEAEAEAEATETVSTHESPETRAVMLALQTETQFGYRDGERFPMDSVDAYATAAKRYLGDASELSSAEIDGADYSVPLEYFREVSGYIKGENTMTERNDVNTDQGKAVIEQIDANIERAASLVADGSDTTEAVAELHIETEDLISSLSGKGSIGVKTAKRAAWTAATEAPAEPAPKAEVVKKTVIEGVVVEKTWDQYEGTKELARLGAEKLAEGVRLHLKAGKVSHEVAAVVFDIWTRIPNKDGLPDLLGQSDPAKKASGEVIRLANEGFERNYDNDSTFKKLGRAVQDSRQDVRAEWLRSLDQDDEIGTARREIMAEVLKGKPADLPASQYVANVYGASLVGPTERKRLEYQAKKEGKELAPAGGNEAEGEGEGEGAEAETPDARVVSVATKIVKDLQGATPDDVEKSSDATKEAIRAQLQEAIEALREMVKATL